ncbi:hypothetical protein EJ04DRAFT_9407 [Polyplosphaeria fusca]|uniref:2EXR domain-containing protein n=1 Tax=Polyplosphaeria fusca TaxID=682080 RepID=A0A9P4R9C6_9PLEO|nr:hypothetical protein EJ04DRAFT_9407 [Polyplosphaeria fusca]
MHSPCYAWHTKASASRTVSNPEVFKPFTPRPPRQSALWIPRTAPRRLARIKPQDARKPCPLATLPAELRIMIYDYILPSTTVRILSPEAERNERTEYLAPCLWPSILRVCRVLRSEFAFQFYTRVNFSAPILSKSNFVVVRRFVARLPVAHRHLLAHNKNFKLRWILPEYLQWGDPQDHSSWVACLRYGNLRSIHKKKHKTHFIAFCRLADWFLWCESMGLADMEWKYEFSFNMECSRDIRGDGIMDFVRDELGAFALPCTQAADITDQQRLVIGKGALRMLDAADHAFAMLQPFGVGMVDVQEWCMRKTRLKRFLENWGLRKSR